MKKLSILCGAFLLLGASANAQLIDEKDVTVTMDLQPVLQLDMSTPDQIQFTFDEISEYYAGITRYAATILKVSSTVSWDLYAVGRSSQGTEFWDQQISYSSILNPNSISDLPMSLLELRQNQPNLGAAAATLAGTALVDYSQAFAPAGTASAGNSLYVNGGTNTAPAITNKYIGGHSGTTGVDDFLPGGSYLTQTNAALFAGTTNFYYAIDYRILPGLPAIFPNAAHESGAPFEDLGTASGLPNAYAEPGLYTMYVQYILLEDQ
jgi:hypothetical protein